MTVLQTKSKAKKLVEDDYLADEMTVARIMQIQKKDKFVPRKFIGNEEEFKKMQLQKLQQKTQLKRTMTKKITRVLPQSNTCLSGISSQFETNLKARAKGTPKDQTFEIDQRLVTELYFTAKKKMRFNDTLYK